MPENTSETSEQVEENLSAPSVLDFLYHDSRRIGSFLAQFEGDGHLTSLTRTKDASRGRTKTISSDIRGSASFLKGGAGSKTETALESAEGYARVFDPYWANARAFLDFLSESDSLNRDISTAEIGQFVLVSGYLSVLDLVMIKDAWKMPSIQRKFLAGNDKPVSQMTAAQRAAQKDSKDNTQLMLELMQILPHSVHASLITSDKDNPALVWGSLREEYLSTPASDITLAHGERMPGVWSIVGILTAFPEYNVPDLSGDLNEANIGSLNSMIGEVAKTLAPIVRFALGRPALAFSVTPLLVYREVA